MKLQDYRKKATKLAYQEAVMAAAVPVMDAADVLEMVGDVTQIPRIEAVCNWLLLAMFDKNSNSDADKGVYPNLHDRVNHWLQGLPLATMNYNNEIVKWLVSKELIHSNFYNGSEDGQWTAAGERHWDYLVRTILDNASPHTVNSII